MGPHRSCWNDITSALKLDEIRPQFHVCNLNKMPIRKKSGNLFNDPRIYIKKSYLKL